MKKLLAAVVIFAACATPAPPPAQPAPAPQPQPQAGQAAIGTVRVSAKVLNVRSEPSLSAEVITQVKKGDRLSLLDAGDEWMHVRLADGSSGYVSAGLVMREGVVNRARKGCPADTDFAFAKAPLPAFTENATAHGIVTVDATVDTKGNVTSTKIISNTTGDESFGIMAEHEIRVAKFVAPIRNCAPRPFIFTYKRSF
jgi:uncharacterized protein YgiM (DUF1202 family)